MNDKTTFEASKMLAELGLSQELLIRHEYWQKATKIKCYLDDISYTMEGNYCSWIGTDKNFFDEELHIAKQNYYRAYSFFELWKMLPNNIESSGKKYMLWITTNRVDYWSLYHGGIICIKYSDFPNEADALAYLIKELKQELIETKQRHRKEMKDITRRIDKLEME